jgi:hypothetical protein
MRFTWGLGYPSEDEESTVKTIFLRAQWLWSLAPAVLLAFTVMGRRWW